MPFELIDEEFFSFGVLIISVDISLNMFVGVFGNVHINGAMHHYTSDVAMVILNVLLKSLLYFGTVVEMLLLMF